MAEANASKKIGEAQAVVIEAIGRAEAERLKLRAEALKNYEKTATMAMALEKIPEVLFSIIVKLLVFYF